MKSLTINTNSTPNQPHDELRAIETSQIDLKPPTHTNICIYHMKSMRKLSLFQVAEIIKEF